MRLVDIIILTLIANITSYKSRHRMKHKTIRKKQDEDAEAKKDDAPKEGEGADGQ